ncbi:AAA family ATPase, partial [bacterium]|nr:AAA family ATPase [bacterium]
MTLFPEQDLKQENMPLAYRLSPKTFDEYMGQEHILSAQKPLRKLIEQDQLRSLLLWGPPGTGKTALSRLIAKKTASGYLALNAVIAKTADIKMAIEQAKVNLTRQQKTILFIDELHRFNKIQQDALLPDVENGLITLIGATTENPFFSVIPALLSRSQVFELKPLSTKHLKIIFEHALQDFIIATYQPRFEAEAVEYLMLQAQGDARKMLNILETAVLSSKKKQEITREFVQTILQTKGVPYNENEHYDTISAFIKSLRGSDADAAI